jgi:predicted alpha/beta hydrolase family esterase
MRDFCEMHECLGHLGFNVRDDSDMKTSDLDLLIVPGWEGSGPDHWQSRWERNLPTARRIEQADWDTPRLQDWLVNIVTAVNAAARPVVFIAHSLGVTTVAHAAACINTERVAGAFLVGAPDIDGLDIWPTRSGGFAPVPLAALPFPSILIASSDDPYCAPDRARLFADAWGATLVDAGAAGHINTASGHGPWPEGLMRLGWFLKRL